MHYAHLALYETGMQLQSQRMELYEGNQLTNQTPETNLFKKIVQDVVKN